MINKPISLVQNEGEPPKLLVPEGHRSQLVTFGYEYLQERGWFHNEPVDEDGYAPWYTYPAIEFLKDILNKNHMVFEYGGGYSTLFFKRYAGHVTTVEHDKVWLDKLLQKDPTLDLIHADENYPIHPEAVDFVNKFIEIFPQIRTDNLQHDVMHGLVNNEFAGYASQLFNKPKGYYNVIVIDGMARSLTGCMAVNRISDDGMIIFDNSDRWHYNQIQQYLISSGFKRLDFWGPGYGAYKAWCTSIFSRQFPFNNNCVDRKISQGVIDL